MEVQARSADRFDRAGPAGHPVEVATPKRRALRASEHQCGWTGRDEYRQVIVEYRDDRSWYAYCSPSSPRLQRAKRDLGAGRAAVGVSGPHMDHRSGQVKVAPLERGDFTPAQARERG